jgi:sulfur carrier protein
MRVKLRNPDRTVEVSGPTTVAGLLQELDIVPEAVLVIRDATLLTRDERLGDDDELEVRPVLSGGAAAAGRGSGGTVEAACPPEGSPVRRAGIPSGSAARRRKSAGRNRER